MLHVAINELTTYGWTFEQDVCHYRQAGVDAIGLWRRKLSDYGEEKGIELLAEMEMRVSSLMWAGGFTGSDGRGHADAMRDALQAVELAGQLRAGSLIVYTGDQGGHTRNHARRVVRGALRELADAAEQHDVTLALEPMHAACARGWTFLTDIPSTLELIDQIGSPRLGLVLDTYHFGRDRAAWDAAAAHIERVALIQLADAHGPPAEDQNRCPLGEGNLPLVEALATLTAAGYRGPVEVELLGADVEWIDCAALLERTTEYLAELGQVRREGVHP